MPKKEYIKYWINSAKHDLAVAQSLFGSKKYDWCLFLGHLVLEKVLKAFWVRDNKSNTIPKIHNLLKIAEQTKLKLSEENKLFLLNVNDFNIEARYPDYKLSFYRKCSSGFTKKYFRQIKDFYKWLIKQM